MKMYADAPLRRSWQIVTDIAVLVFVAATLWLALQIHHEVDDLAHPGETTQKAATTLGDNLRTAGSVLDDVPIIGGGISEPFEQSADGADDIASAGQRTADGARRLAVWLAVWMAAVPNALALGYYLPGRVRFIRRATAGRRFIDNTGDLDLFALRALATQPMHVLAQFSEDPVGGWRRGDPDLIEQLAILELRDSGLDPHRRIRSS